MLKNILAEAIASQQPTFGMEGIEFYNNYSDMVIAQYDESQYLAQLEREVAGMDAAVLTLASTYKLMQDAEGGQSVALETLTDSIEQAQTLVAATGVEWQPVPALESIQDKAALSVSMEGIGDTLKRLYDELGKKLKAIADAFKGFIETYLTRAGALNRKVQAQSKALDGAGDGLYSDTILVRNGRKLLDGKTGTSVVPDVARVKDFTTQISNMMDMSALREAMSSIMDAVTEKGGMDNAANRVDAAQEAIVKHYNLVPIQGRMPEGVVEVTTAAFNEYFNVQRVGSKERMYGGGWIVASAQIPTGRDAKKFGRLYLSDIRLIANFAQGDKSLTVPAPSKAELVELNRELATTATTMLNFKRELDRVTDALREYSADIQALQKLTPAQIVEAVLIGVVTSNPANTVLMLLARRYGDVLAMLNRQVADYGVAVTEAIYGYVESGRVNLK